MKNKMVFRVLVACSFVAFISACASKPAGEKARVPGTEDSLAKCSIGKADLKGILKVPSPLIIKYFGGLTDEANTFSESALLSNKTKITYTVRGCEHLSYKINYKNVRPKNQTDAAFIDLAIQLLRETPFQDSEVNKRDIFIRSLQAAKASPKMLEKSQVSLDCGDASCSYDYREKSVVTLDYDFAL